MADQQPQNSSNVPATNGNGTPTPTTNAMSPHMTQNASPNGIGDSRVMEMVHNALMARDQLFQRFFGNRTDINQALDYPDSLQASFYRDLYDRMGIAERVVQLLPKESWQVSPKVYEEDNSEKPTEFEEAWDNLGQYLHSAGRSWHKDEEGSIVWNYLYRGDMLAGIGVFGILLLGLDDGRLLQDPVEGSPLDGAYYDMSGVADLQTKDIYGGQGTQGGGTGYPNPAMGTVGTDAMYSGTQFSPMVVSPSVQGRDTKAVSSIKEGKNSYQQGQQSGEQGAAKTGAGAGQSPSKGGGKNGDKESAPQDTRSLKPGQKPKPLKVKPKRLLFVRCFDETMVQVVQYEASIYSPRFGQPLMYLITLNDPRQPHTGIGLPLATVRVHWSRVIHLADNLGSSEVFGTPRMRPIINNILDLRKVYGGSAEMYWRGAFPGLSIETHPQLGGDVVINRPALDTMMREYFSGLDRTLALMGMSAKSLAPQVSDPTSQIAIQIEAICIELGVPVRVFKGSERGELASSQDDSSWNDRLRHRQTNYVTPKVIAPFIDRLIMLGVLPEPEHYHVEWPDLDSQTDAQKATNAMTIAQAIGLFVSGNLETVMTFKDFLVHVLMWEEELADTVIENAREQHQTDQEDQMPMTMPQIGEQGHPATPPPPPPKVIAPGMPGGVPGAGAGAGGKGGMPGLPKPGQGAPPPSKGAAQDQARIAAAQKVAVSQLQPKPLKG